MLNRQSGREWVQQITGTGMRKPKQNTTFMGVQKMALFTMHDMANELAEFAGGRSTRRNCAVIH